MKYNHGGDLNTYAKQNGCSIDEIIDLSSNINFIKPKSKLDISKVDISSYPNYEKIYKKLAKYYGVGKSKIELFNGGSSAIFSLFQNIALKHCTIYSPAYLEYKRAAECFGYEMVHINRFENIYQDVASNSLVIFVNPSTPDGTYYDMKKLFEIWQKADATVLVDESFLEFCKKQSVSKYLKEYKKLYILKSLTKIYGCAGVRVGVLISSKENIQKLQTTQPLWKLSRLDVAYIENILEDKSLITRTIKTTKINKKYLVDILKASTLVKKIYQSEANFILVQLDNITAQDFQKMLSHYNIMVRDCSNFDFLDDSFVRIAVKDIKSIKIFKKAIQ